MVFMHLWNSSTNTKCNIFSCVLYDSCIENAAGPLQTDRQTDELIRVGLGNLIRFLQVKGLTTIDWELLRLWCS
jgi:hypothetical protein